MEIHFILAHLIVFTQAFYCALDGVCTCTYDGSGMITAVCENPEIVRFQPEVVKLIKELIIVGSDETCHSISESHRRIPIKCVAR